ncbi:MAG: hypothetical protein ING08_03985 [Roseomonas sp.]|nr:hypothetical protein [Roseomonas sp.]MCA3379381.1 hypothetical protein [Roseomonas sp.]
MKVIKEWILALCVMFLVFSVLFGAFVVYVFVDTDLKNISKRCICPTIISDGDFRQFALDKMLQYGDPRVLYQQNLDVNPDYKITEIIGTRRWSYTHWSYIRGANFRLQAPSDHSQKSNIGSFEFSIDADECGRVLNVETLGVLAF